MAQAIETKWTGPGMIRAKAGRGAKTFRVPDNIDGDRERHQWAAREPCRHFVAEDVKTYGDAAGSLWGAPFFSGCLPSGHWAHVFDAL